MGLEPPTDNAFVTRLVRVLAWIGVAYAICSIVTFAWQLQQFGISGLRGLFAAAQADVSAALTNLMFISDISIHILLLISTIAVLRRFGWARYCLFSWAVAAILFGLITTIQACIQVLKYYGSAPIGAPNNPYIMWGMLTSWLTSCIGPVVVLYLLHQPEVKAALRSSIGTGFDVLPANSQAD